MTGSTGETVTLEKNCALETPMRTGNVLKQIGTKKSLAPLKELTGDPVKELSEAAAEAARSIQGREKSS